LGSIFANNSILSNNLDSSSSASSSSSSLPDFQEIKSSVVIALSPLTSASQETKTNSASSTPHVADRSHEPASSTQPKPIPIPTPHVADRSHEPARKRHKTNAAQNKDDIVDSSNVGNNK